ncbi:dynein axonemal assembly factor 8-like isoform X1 [Lytechinus pictus]|uniref:dynein axonemal assembly factor 8-like isoform X1 n=1 Tax=Lytechinus pictus TaxID=7653 RepID=UPI0030B9DC09
MAEHILEALSSNQSTELYDEIQDLLAIVDKESDKISTAFDENLFSEVSELQPKMDTIFADIQASIPSLDFEASSVSSDEELSVFNRSMKTPHSDRDPTEDTLTPEAWRKALEPTQDLEDIPVQAPTYEYIKLSQDSSPYRNPASFKSSMPKLVETETSGEPTSPRVFNRRLMSMSSTGSDDGTVRSPLLAQDLVPRDMIPSIDDFDDGEDILGHSGSSFGNSEGSLGQSGSSLQTVISSVVAESFGLDFEDDLENLQQDIDQGDSILDVAQESVPVETILAELTKDPSRTVDNREVFQEQSESDAIIEAMLPAEVPTLAIEKVDFIDLDLLIDAFPERSNIMEGSGGQPGGKGDGSSVDNTCLMDKLAQLCIDQSGGKISKADLTPSHSQQGRSKKKGKGLAAKPPKPPPKVVWEEKTSPKRVNTSTSPPKPIETTQNKSASTGTSTVMDHSTLGVGEPSNIAGKGKEMNLQRSKQTVYLDLRPKKEDEDELSSNAPSKAVQRILQLHSKQNEGSSSDDSSDDEDSALGWHEKRRKIMQKLGQVKGQSSLTSVGNQTGDNERAAARDREPMRNLVAKQHRVIHIVHDEGRTESSTQTLPVVKSIPVPRETYNLQLPPNPPQSPSSQGNLTPQRRTSLGEDQGNHKDQIPNKKDQDRDHNVVLARKLREQKEKERQEHLKFQKKLETLHPQMTMSAKRKEIAKATDVIFDLEASYKPESNLLPSNLKPTHETALLTVTMTTVGNILLHKSSGKQPLEKLDSQISGTYIVLLSWFLSLVPKDLDYLNDPTVEATCGASGIDNTPFRVLGLQQIWKDGKLQLLVAITPPCMDSTKQSPIKAKKGKLRNEVRDMTPFQQTVSKFLTSKNLHTLAPWLPLAFRFAQEFSGEPLDLKPIPMEATQEGATDTGTYIPPYPQVSSKPLATYVALSTSPCAVEGAFTSTPGFFWRTLDAEEAVYDQLTNDEYSNNGDIQNTLTVFHDAIYHFPSRQAGVLYRLLQEGLDISGLRLMYNSKDLLSSPRVLRSKQCGNESGMPVVVLGIRGNLARTRWLDAVGPSDPQLAKRTDPYSLMALYGGTTRDDLTIICPRNPSRINYELSLWFGARGTNDRLVEAPDSVPSRLDRRVRSESPKQKKNRKGSRKDSWSSSSNEDLESTGLSASTLVASTSGDMVLSVSPLVPPMCLGMILSSCLERGYQLRGIKRVRLNSRRANSLGLQGKQVSVFSPMSCSTPTSPKNCEEALRKRLEAGLPASTNPPLPSILIHLRAENTMRNAGGLIYTLMIQLSRQGLLSSIQANAETNLKSSLCFHVTPFSDNLLSNLGGDFSRIPEHDVYHGVSVPSSFYSNPELEQIVVVTFSGAKTLKLLGNTLGKLLGVYPVTSTNNLMTPRANPGEGLELLGIKFLPSLTAFQAKELTPFEVGDRSWQPSVHTLVSNPAVICVLRGINAFHHVRSVLKIPTHPNDFRRGAKLEVCMERLMSASAEIAFRQASMFFRDHELFADPSMRANLPYQPPLRSPSLEELSNARFAWAEDHGLSSKKTKYKANAGETKGTVLVEESIFKTMLAGPRPITTTLVIKPGALKNFSKILKRVCQEDFIIVALGLLTLNDQQAMALVPEREAENSVICNMHLDHLTSGPVLVLVLQRENAVRKLLSLLGPNNPKEAKKKNEFLWRGMFGADPINNALHGSMTYAKAVEEQILFFPEGLCCRLTSDLKADKITCPAVDTVLGSSQASKRSFMLRIGSHGDTNLSLSESLISHNGDTSPRSIGVGTSTADLTLHSHSALCQTNCILLTPPLQLLNVNGHRKGYVDVIDCLRHRGFIVVGARMIWFTQAQAKEYVSIYSGAFPNLGQLLCHGPSIVLAIQRDNAVSCLGSLLGNMLDKESVINKYGKHIMRPKDTKEAIKHLEFFFNELIPGSQGEIVSDDASLGFLSS